MNQTIGIISDVTVNAGNVLALKASLPFVLTVVFLWISAIYFLVRMPHAESLRVGEMPAAAS